MRRRQQFKVGDRVSVDYLINRPDYRTYDTGTVTKVGELFKYDYEVLMDTGNVVYFWENELAASDTKRPTREEMIKIRKRRQAELDNVFPFVKKKGVK